MFCRKPCESIFLLPKYWYAIRPNATIATNRTSWKYPYGIGARQSSIKAARMR